MTIAKNVYSIDAHFRIAALLSILLAVSAPASAQNYTVLHDFNSNSGPNDPFFSIIAQGRDGAMYTTSQQGFTGGQGDVFKITPQGKLTVLHEFHGLGGEIPIGGLTLATDGKFYGTTSSGGDFGFGTIFSITAEGTPKKLYSFRDKKDGSVPQAAPIEGEDGDFYGVSSSCTGLGENNSCLTENANKFGAVYKITAKGKFTLLHTFNGRDGGNPIGHLLQASDGKFYGTTLDGGAHNLGVIFRISSSGEFKVLFNFDSRFGAGPFAALTQGSDGDLYGVTSGENGGTVFQLGCNGVKILHNFAGGENGTNPVGGLVQATDGKFYGTNNIGPLDFVGGVIFRINPAGAFATLHKFDFTSGGSAQTTILQHTNGLLYGETCCGGSFSVGVFYRLNAHLRPYASFLPASGHFRSTIEILGQGFKGATRVSFNGKRAAFKVISDTFLIANVPPGATTGFVTVVTANGTLTSNKKFVVIHGKDEVQRRHHNNGEQSSFCEQDQEHRN